MQVAVVTFDGFNELDSFIASALINRCRKDGLEAFVTTPEAVVTSMNGVEVTGQRPLEFVTEADVVLIGSGVRTRDVLDYVAPVGENDETVERALRAVDTGRTALR